MAAAGFWISGMRSVPIPLPVGIYQKSRSGGNGIILFCPCAWTVRLIAMRLFNDFVNVAWEPHAFTQISSLRQSRTGTPATAQLRNGYPKQLSCFLLIPECRPGIGIG